MQKIKLSTGTEARMLSGMSEIEIEYYDSEKDAYHCHYFTKRDLEDMLELMINEMCLS